MAKYRVVLCGGGTGGHYYPVLSVAQRLAEEYETEFLYFTIAGRLDDERVEMDLPNVRKIPLKLKGLLRPIYNPKNIGIILEHLEQMRLVKEEISKFKPDFLFSSGGYVSFPVVLAAKKLDIPIFLHEQNALPGIANKRLAKYATKVFISFEESASRFGKYAYKTCLTGNPVRKVSMSREEIFNTLEFDPTKPFIVVMGGSQGSDFINEKMLQLYSSICDDDGYQFLHVTGKGSNMEDFRKYPFVRVFEYIPNIHEYMAKADLVISRGGATSVAEIMNYRRKAIIIPWSGAAENHQYYNAVSLEKVGLGYVILENAVTPELLLSRIRDSLRKKTVVVPYEKEPVELIVENLFREESR
ncbi:UDP-N-acetylglucosamine--N-acetylmuramyl-(pentapeptide) pyrophosphoryl-undecaprenol N-acetylglucosamine transferase [Kosmotoga pacifica]|uniref:UDP-N-acetylglucosamine--N-acetylmuramyl-(pentapeptide) pyrophosphoryl-undecaprenol N-acetylglucosamine transferase n=1 Tax=Kosmotoga pacifica TaxID=1330330 RepID=A0A0G2ZC09_9BACT|nr:UDP-N-acetylglucosamine--N-acetylmuramyl-(pentapeptide) pyrophosphoryl-undecaprenol N-acetylglucosamine transferase [Kosmotoga pacifica]AKI97094.1 UDP-N-acetylglucosamine-N-acetylmuramyl- (pentapeptide) pyrophosphoryl-UDP acetylglucosamine transferase [Kosmotoga pacifica]